ncbi:hypothetical protein I3843_05G187500, partial [Carya illinoinensis]
MSELLSEWTWEENKVFENTLAMYSEYLGKELWEKISSLIPTKTPSQISLHFKHLVEDIRDYTNEHAEKKEQKMDEDDEDDEDGNN